MPRSKKEPVLPLRTSDRRNGAGSPQRSRRAASNGACGGSLVSRCLCVVLVLYFQLSTFTLVQWVREHGLEAEHGLAAALSRKTSAQPPQTGLSPSPPPLAAHASAAAAVPAAQALSHTLPPHTQPAPATQPELHQQIAAAAAAAEYRGEQQPAAAEDEDEEEPPPAELHAAAADGLQLDGLELEEHDAAAADAAAAAAAATAGKVDDWLSSESYGKFIGISTFFNPGRHENKVENFRKFKGAVAAQGLQMLCVELVFGDSTFQLLDASSDAPDCEIMVQRRTSEGNTLWQKERLLNIALDNLPASVTKVMWLDSDLIFLNDDWVPETAELLDQYPVVQPFGWMTYLPADQGSEYGTEKLPTLPLGQGVGGVYHGAGLGVSQFGELCFRANFVIGHPGFAWAARREVITSAGFYDRSIIGGGDRIMLNAFTGHYNGVSRKMPPMMAEDVRAFGARLTPLVGPANMSYTRGVVLHIWHGDRANRDYKNRYNILLANKYNPGVDVRINEAGVLEWATEKRRLHSQVTEYFNNRKEGPKATNRSHEDDVWTAQRKDLSRPVRSFLGYHCNREEYRPFCKKAFALWGEALRVTQLQLRQKELRALQKAAPAAQQGGKKKKRKKASYA